jgi:hypothetical protein
MSIDVNVQNDLVIVTESSEDITVNVSNAAGPAGVGVPVGGTTGQVLKKFTNTNYDTYWAADASGLTSVGLSMPSAFAVSNSPLTSNGTIAVTGAGTASQYVRGDGQLANFPTNGGGGSSVNYYLNGSVNQGTFGGDTYYEMSKTPILGAGTNFTRTNGQGNGYIASFITDAGDPSLLNIPGGNWNLEFYFQSSSNGGSPQFYAELYKVSSADVFTLVASGSTNPEGITNGTTVDQYFTSIPVPQTSLLVTDRLAIRIYVITSGRTITLHTEDGNLCEVLTTFSTGLNALNGLTAQVQYFATGTSGTDFAISSATDTHTFNLPTASATNRGALSSADWSTFSGKVGGSGATGQVAYWNGTSSQTGSNNLFWNTTNNSLGIGSTLVNAAYKLGVSGNFALTGYLGFVGSGGLNNPGQLGYIELASTSFDFYVDSTRAIKFMNSAERMRIFASTGNVVLQNGGTFTDGGQRLQVQGDAFIKGSGNTSATTALTVQNSDSAALMSLPNDFANTRLNIFGSTNTYFRANQTTANRFVQYGSNGTNADFYVGSAITAYTFSNNGGYVAMQINTNPLPTAGGNLLEIPKIGTVFNPTSGTATFTTMLVIPIINQTGGANGITRGLYIVPTLTSAADWRSIEWSNNSGWGLYGAGTANNQLNGNLGLGVAPRAWGSSFKAIEFQTGAISDGNSSYVFAYNYFFNGTNPIYKNNGQASAYQQYLGQHVWYTATSGTAGNVVTLTQPMTLTAAGRLLLGTTTESTFLLDVNGTARVSGATTISLNQNAKTELTISNTTSGTNSSAAVTITSTNGGLQLSKYSPLTTAYKIISGGDSYVYNYTGGDIAILNDFATGTIKLAAGGSSTAQMTLTSNGNLLLNTNLPSRHTSSSFPAIFVANTNSGIFGETTSGYKGINLNANIVRDTSLFWTCQDTTQPGWLMGLNYETANADEFVLNRTAATSGTASFVKLFSVKGNGYVSIGLDTTAATALTDIGASTTARASLRLRSGTAPTSPNNGDIWFDGTDLKIRVGGVTKTFTLV